VPFTGRYKSFSNFNAADVQVRAKRVPAKLAPLPFAVRHTQESQLAARCVLTLTLWRVAVARSPVRLVLSRHR
jgi:hypothetical protein